MTDIRVDLVRNDTAVLNKMLGQNGISGIRVVEQLDYMIENQAKDKPQENIQADKLGVSGAPNVELLGQS